ncbi:MAG TPA: hypothetical protein VGB73_06305, partial [Pyrinomonadaceae bacterium]
MINLRFRFALLAAVLLAFVASLSFETRAQQPSGGRARFDVTHYRIEVELRPSENFLNAIGDVTFTPLDATRSVVFELNGSLKVEGIERNGAALTNFVQDAAGYDTMGPSVRVDLGEVVPAGQPVTLRFKWSGALVSPEGGPLATKRLAYVGNEGSYLMYAARWFPFHDYAADRATSDITIAVPQGFEVAGATEDPATAAPQQQGALRRFRFVTRQPALVGNFAAGRFITRSLRMGPFEMVFYVRPGSEGFIQPYGEAIGNALQFYARQYGQPAFGTRFVVAQIDDASLDAYAAHGMQFLSERFFQPSRQLSLDERVERETAFQWWGHTVGLKSFDDVWLSQGLAEWSAYALRESRLSGAQLEAAQRDMMERALMFEQSASILRA